ncbi:MAG TPA: S41 family peptidase [Kiritimatiellia bacterium]|nr:S41 family peptidase [Kiritimatiellia bacterium]
MVKGFSRRHALGAGTALVLLANLVIGARIYSQEAAAGKDDQAYENLALFTRVLEEIRIQYVDEDKTEYQDLIYGALEGMLASLDEHSQFLDPEMYTEMKEETSGQFGGLGIVISLQNGILTVVSPMDDTPGFRAGLTAGDQIIEIDGENMEGSSLQEAVKKLRGTPGTKVSLKIHRPESREYLEMEIERAIINVETVKDARMLDGGIGYVRITQFSEPTAGALQKALDELFEQGMQALVLDLRYNPGGLLTSAVEVSQKFLKKNKVIVSTRGRDEKEAQVFRARGREHYADLPLAVLVNSGSASASEIVSGALQDHNRAIIIGEKTFGKGSVQSVLPQQDGSAIRLTTSKYYTPDGRVIHEKGIEPDIRVSMPHEVWQKLMLRKQSTEQTGGEDVKDVQLERAVDVLRGIRIFQTQNRKGIFTARSGG